MCLRHLRNYLLKFDCKKCRKGASADRTYYIDLFDSETVEQLGQIGIKRLAQSFSRLVLVSIWMERYLFCRLRRCTMDAYMSV